MPYTLELPFISPCTKRPYHLVVAMLMQDKKKNKSMGKQQICIKTLKAGHRQVFVHARAMLSVFELEKKKMTG
jgi:hypothetical protein